MDAGKIDLVLSGTEVFVWSADDWLKLRQDYRILGNCIGCFTKKTRQINFNGLPMLLLPEEAKLLIEKGLARLTTRPILKETPTESLKKKFEEYRHKLHSDQQLCLIEQRKQQVASMMDRIVDGKRRKMLGLHTKRKRMKKPLDSKTMQALDNIQIDREALFEEEIAKLPQLQKFDPLVQTHTAYPWHTGVIKIEDWNYPTTEEEIFRYKVFRDIWEEGYFVTSGEKFGCDFLAYPGDPIMFHSQLLIHCRNRNEEMSVTELVTETRIGTHVRKTTVYATLSKDSESIEYFSSRWADSSMGELKE